MCSGRSVGVACVEIYENSVGMRVADVAVCVAGAAICVADVAMCTEGSATCSFHFGRALMVGVRCGIVGLTLRALNVLHLNLSIACLHGMRSVKGSLAKAYATPRKTCELNQKPMSDLYM